MCMFIWPAAVSLLARATWLLRPQLLLQDALALSGCSLAFLSLDHHSLVALPTPLNAAHHHLFTDSLLERATMHSLTHMHSHNPFTPTKLEEERLPPRLRKEKICALYDALPGNAAGAYDAARDSYTMFPVTATNHSVCELSRWSKMDLQSILSDDPAGQEEGTLSWCRVAD